LADEARANRARRPENRPIRSDATPSNLFRSLQNPR